MEKKTDVGNDRHPAVVGMSLLLKTTLETS